jgi:ribosomal protein S18 acetylase RimI-like enzyme
LSIKIGKNLVGWCQIGHYSNGESEISRIEILPQLEKRGLGRKILGKLSAILLREKAKRIILHGGKANAFYDKTNFKKTGHRDKRQAFFKKK